MRTATALALGMLVLLAAVPGAAAEQRFAFPSDAPGDPVALSRAMPDLARALLASSAGGDRRTDLDDRFRLQIVAGEYAAAAGTLTALQRLNGTASPWSATNYAQYDIFVRAKRMEAAGLPLDTAFARSFRRFVDPLDDRRAALVVRRFAVHPAGFRADLRGLLLRRRGRPDIAQHDALALVRAYQLATMYDQVAPRAAASIAADDRRRYAIDADRLIATPDGARICTLIVRPRSARRLPALLQFTIYADRMANLSDARRSASNGYAGVAALTRGKGCSPNAIVPYEHDGADGVAVIDWISRQSWSDGRVGMFGGSYNSFAQWAVAKHHPRALKALMPSVPNAPGIDTPMEANVFQSFSYDWPFYVGDTKWLDASTQGDPAHWAALQKRWYVSGRPYRAMDRIDGRPNPVWDRWLRHPRYDTFWQRLVPYQREFARISVPVLVTDGYLGGQSVGGLYYFEQYRRYSPRAESYLVLGPYDHVRGQRGTGSTTGPDLNVVAGYAIDPAAHLDIEELRYQWFDYVLKGRPKPVLLRGRVNYEVMGANRWKHAPAIAAMHDRMLRLHLDTTRTGARYTLAQQPPRRADSIAQTVDLADRTDVDRVPPAGLDTYLGVAFQSGPFAHGFDSSGVFSGRLDFVTNKKDLDFNVSLYQLTPQGEYVAITYFMARASYVRDRAHRRLLQPGRRTQLDFVASRLTSWHIRAGSRLVIVLSIVKDPGIQLNYGTGKDVSDESIADAKTPLRITWFNRSFVDVPVSAAP